MTLPWSFKPDSEFEHILDIVKKQTIDDLHNQSYGGMVPDNYSYAYLNPISFKRWYDGMSRQSTLKML